jgi:hypothetical protein
MIRPVLAVSASALAFGAAALLVAPQLNIGWRGEPMLVAGSEAFHPVQAVSFDHDPCDGSQVLAEAAIDTGGGLRIVTVAIGPDGADSAVTVAEFPGRPGEHSATILLIVDPAGKLISATAAPVAAAPKAAACALKLPELPKPGSV